MCRHLSLKGNGVSDIVFRVISTPKGFPIEKVPRNTLKRKPFQNCEHILFWGSKDI